MNSEYESLANLNDAFESWLEANYEFIYTLGNKNVWSDGYLYFWEPEVMDTDFIKYELEYEDLMEIVEKLKEDNKQLEQKNRELRAKQ